MSCDTSTEEHSGADSTPRFDILKEEFEVQSLGLVFMPSQCPHTFGTCIHAFMPLGLVFVYHMNVSLQQTLTWIISKMKGRQFNQMLLSCKRIHITKASELL